MTISPSSSISPPFINITSYHQYHLLSSISPPIINITSFHQYHLLTWVRHCDRLRALLTGQRTRDLYFRLESELHGNDEVGNRTGDLWRSRRAFVTKPLCLIQHHHHTIRLIGVSHMSLGPEKYGNTLTW